jgi:hypothetical protein
MLLWRSQTQSETQRRRGGHRGGLRVGRRCCGSDGAFCQRKRALRGRAGAMNLGAGAAWQAMAYQRAAAPAAIEKPASISAAVSSGREKRRQRARARRHAASINGAWRRNIKAKSGDLQKALGMCFALKQAHQRRALAIFFQQTTWRARVRVA